MIKRLKIASLKKLCCKAIALRSGKKIEDSKPKEALISTHDSNKPKEEHVTEREIEVEKTNKALKPKSISFPNNQPIIKPFYIPRDFRRISLMHSLLRSWIFSRRFI